MTSENNQMFKNKSEKNSVKYYSCKACGNTFDANPPNEVHKFSSVYQCWKIDWIESIDEYLNHSEFIDNIAPRVTFLKMNIMSSFTILDPVSSAILLIFSSSGESIINLNSFCWRLINLTDSAYLSRFLCK
jgi:hypothetical protein